MDLYLAGNTRLQREKDLVAQGNTNRLLSYWEYKRKTNDSFEFWKDQVKEGKGKLFLDCGAYSAMKKNQTVDMDAYIEFVKKHADGLTIYAALDVIDGSPEETLANYRIMKEKGITPLPVYHGGEDWKYLDIYAEESDYIAIGGVAGLVVNRDTIRGLMDHVFNRYPNHKFHAFGITILSILAEFPFYSCDSTSWLMCGAMGSVMTPYGNVYVSDQGHKEKDHYIYKSEGEKEVIKDYVEKQGFTIEQIAGDYTYRLLLNAKYMKDFQDSHNVTKPRIKRNFLF